MPPGAGWLFLLIGWGADDDKRDFPFADVAEAPACFLLNVGIGGDIRADGFEVRLLLLQLGELALFGGARVGELLGAIETERGGVNEVAADGKAGDDDQAGAAEERRCHRQLETLRAGAARFKAASRWLVSLRA